MRALIVLAACAAALSAAPQRIVSTAPAITETLFALGLGEQVAGVTEYCHFPAEARKKPKIGGYLRPSLESIIALRPDLVIAERAPSAVVAQLARLKIAEVDVQFRSVQEIFASIDKIAGAAGVPERGVALRNSMQHNLDQIRSRVKASPRVSLMFVVGRTPGTLNGLIVAGGSSYLTELMDVAGGRNAFSDSAVGFPKVTLEEVLARDPQVIVDRADMADQGGATEEQKRVVLNLWHKYPSLNAPRHDRVFPIDSDIFVVPGPRIVDAARAFAKMLHPEVKW